MFDITINTDGTPYTDNGDFETPNYGGYVSQKIYRALMSMDPITVTGTDETKPQDVINNVKAYLADYFWNDGDIEPSELSVSMKQRGGQNLNLSVELNTTSPDGGEVGVVHGMDYNMGGGALKSINYDPEWLTEIDNDSVDEESIEAYITINESTTDIELPVPPVISTSDEDEIVSETELDSDKEYIRVGVNGHTKYPIYIRDVNSSFSVETETLTFELEIDPQKMIYPIGRLLENYSEKTNIITFAEIDMESIPAGATAKIIDEYGEISVFVTSGTGKITGSAEVTTAKYATNNIIIKDTLSRDYVYKLRPARGRYTAVFTKSVSPGTYMIQYRGNKHRRV